MRIPAREAPAQGPFAFAELRGGDSIAWGDPVGGLAVGIGRVRAFLGGGCDLIIDAYLENRGGRGLRNVIAASAGFTVQVDGRFFKEPVFGGISGWMRPGERYGPIVIDTEQFCEVGKLEACPSLDTPRVQTAVRRAQCTIRIYYEWPGQQVVKPKWNLIPSGEVAINIPSATRADEEQVVAALEAMLKNGGYQSQATALRKLSRIPGEKAAAAIIRTIKDRDQAVRAAAARALSGRGSRAVVEALLRALSDENKEVRRSAARSLGKCSNRSAVEPLRQRLGDPDMGMRLSVVLSLLELGEPLDVEWVVPIIRSKEMNEFQGAIWVVRRHAGKQAVPTLIGCLEVTDPSVDNYYNYTLVWQIGACGGPDLKYHHDFESKGTEEQIRENRRTLETLKAWSASRGEGRSDPHK